MAHKKYMVYNDPIITICCFTPEVHRLVMLLWLDLISSIRYAYWNQAVWMLGRVFRYL